MEFRDLEVNLDFFYNDPPPLHEILYTPLAASSAIPCVQSILSIFFYLYTYTIYIYLLLQTLLIDRQRGSKAERQNNQKHWKSEGLIKEILQDKRQKDQRQKDQKQKDKRQTDRKSERQKS